MIRVPLALLRHLLHFFDAAFKSDYLRALFGGVCEQCRKTCFLALKLIYAPSGASAFVAQRFALLFKSIRRFFRADALVAGEQDVFNCFAKPVAVDLSAGLTDEDRVHENAFRYAEKLLPGLSVTHNGLSRCRVDHGYALAHAGGGVAHETERALNAVFSRAGDNDHISGGAAAVP